MTDRYRYLPCALHEALAVPAWAMCGLKGELLPFVYSTRGPGDLFDVDLSHPAGWDHAVRALAAMNGEDVPESASCWFGVDTERSAGWCIRTDGPIVLRFSSTEPEDMYDYGGRRVPGLTDDPPSTTPESRREALCRCICAALNLRVEEVFP
jgi:hypothetical protein